MTTAPSRIDPGGEDDLACPFLAFAHKGDDGVIRNYRIVCDVPIQFVCMHAKTEKERDACEREHLNLTVCALCLPAKSALADSGRDPFHERLIDIGVTPP